MKNKEGSFHEKNRKKARRGKGKRVGAQDQILGSVGWEWGSLGTVSPLLSLRVKKEKRREKMFKSDCPSVVEA